MLEDDLKYVFYAFLGGIFSALSISSELATGLFIVVALYCAISGIYILAPESGEKRSYGHTQSKKPDQIAPTTSAPITDEPTIADRVQEIHIKNDFKCPSCGATVLPTDVKCRHCGSILVDTVNLPRPKKWAAVEIGQAVLMKHPRQGEINLAVQNRVYYGELWQAQMRQDVPWTLTGNYYARLGLGGDTYLLNWQDRFYLLDSQSSLTDMDINRDFAPYARQFAASNQTANFSFRFRELYWHMEDIGRFRIEFAEGDGIKVSPGAVGRFIHASHDNRVLVVEDYQTGGSGLDTLWMGYRIEEEDIKL